MQRVGAATASCSGAKQNRTIGSGQPEARLALKRDALKEFVVRSSSQQRRSGVTPLARGSRDGYPRVQDLERGIAACWSYITHRRHDREGHAQKTHEGHAVHPQGLWFQVRVVVENVSAARCHTPTHKHKPPPRTKRTPRTVGPLSGTDELSQSPRQRVSDVRPSAVTGRRDGRRWQCTGRASRAAERVSSTAENGGLGEVKPSTV
jgi:hypothetical protein